jgi:hypothetical protein
MALDVQALDVQKIPRGEGEGMNSRSSFSRTAPSPEKLAWALPTPAVCKTKTKGLAIAAIEQGLTRLSRYATARRRIGVEVQIEFRGGLGVIVGDLARLEGHTAFLAMGIYDMIRSLDDRQRCLQRNTVTTLSRNGGAVTVARGPFVQDGRRITYQCHPLALAIYGDGAIQWLSPNQGTERPLQLTRCDAMVYFLNGISDAISAYRHRYGPDRAIRTIRYSSLPETAHLIEDNFEAITLVLDRRIFPINELGNRTLLPIEGQQAATGLT